MMKKLISVLLVVLVLFGAAAAMAADTETFKPSLTNAMEFSAREWMQSDLYRCVLSLMLGVEGMMEEDAFDVSEFMLEDIYVTYLDEDKDALVVYYVNSKEIYSIMYLPDSGVATVPGKLDVTSTAGFENVIKELDIDYYKNTTEGMLNALEILNEAISD